VTRKHAEAVGSATPDPIAGQAAVQPIPPVAISNKPAPGQTGPRGMGPRQTYSRVNTGLPPTPEAGLTAQKSGPNLGLNTLPKLSEAQMTDTFLPHMDLNTLLKSAMDGTASRAQVAVEAARQLQLHGGEVPETKTASARTTPHFATEQLSKLASALAYVADELDKTAEPGEGPGALTVTETTVSGESLQPGQSGQATAGNQPPRTPATQASQTPGGGASTGLEDNGDMQHAEQPVEPIPNEKASLENDKSKTAASLLNKNASRISALAGKAKEVVKSEAGKVKDFAGQVGQAAKKNPGTAAALGGALAAGAALKATRGTGVPAALAGNGKPMAYAAGHRAGKKEASVFDLIRAKQAEDAINPASISAGTAPDAGGSPTGATPSGEGSVAVPSDVTSQANMIGSNEAAINFTKGQAKADPKKDLRNVLNEPPLSAATDKVLNQAFANTGAAGVKIAAVREAAVKTAAARQYLHNIFTGSQNQGG
jgi:hypothetical protein